MVDFSETPVGGRITRKVARGGVLPYGVEGAGAVDENGDPVSTVHPLAIMPGSPPGTPRHGVDLGSVEDVLFAPLHLLGKIFGMDWGDDKEPSTAQVIADFNEKGLPWVRGDTGQPGNAAAMRINTTFQRDNPSYGSFPGSQFHQDIQTLNQWIDGHPAGDAGMRTWFGGKQ